LISGLTDLRSIRIFGCVDNDSADLLFRSLGDSGRRQVARILAEEPLTVGEIADVLGLPQSTVSRHLKTLRSTGLLVDRKEGSRVFIGLTPSESRNGGRDLSAVLNSWLRQQPISGAVAARLRRAVSNRNGGVDPFERFAHRWDELRFEHFGGLFHMEAIASLLPSEWRVLDIGTGTGYLLPFLSRQFREVIAADASAAMLDLARQRAQREGLSNVQFESGRLEDLPVGDASVDCALAVLVLRYSAHPARSAAELARVVKAGGRLLVVDVVPHDMDDFRRRIGDMTGGIEPSEVASVLGRAGFRVSQTRTLHLPAAPSPCAPSRPAPDLFLITAERESPRVSSRTSGGGSAGIRQPGPRSSRDKPHQP
jgi:ArsR family transcriptional regulator